MKFVFLMDPIHTINMEKDTSFILMLGACRKGHEVYYLLDGGMTQVAGELSFAVQRVIPQQVSAKPFIIQESLSLREKDVDAVFIRTDPPFDLPYLVHTWLLDRLADRIPVINHPAGIRTVNEKIWASRFTSLVPPTLIGRNRGDLAAFVREHKTVIAKPTDGYGGQSIFRLSEGDLNINVILETVSQGFSKDIILQKYIPEASEGDKRILLLDGEPLGAVLRVHAADDHRNNFFSGGKPVATQITQRDREIISALKPELQKLGLWFVGIDILGGYLIEVNVTSPTCLQEINALTGQSLEDRVIDFVENLIEKKGPGSKIRA